MGFIAQTFGNSFWSSSNDVQQSASPSTRKYRPKHKPSKDGSHTSISVPASEQLIPSHIPNTHKKRRHDSSEMAFRPPCAGIASELGRPSMSSSSVASDEPLILRSTKGKAKVHGSSPMSQVNPNQSACAPGAWSSVPQSPPRLQARPPTVNSLDLNERSQLVRRSRKLGAILGETPRLLDVDEDDRDAEEALSRLEGRQVDQFPLSAELSCQRPSTRRSLTLEAISIGSTLSPSTPVSASRRSFLLNNENSANTPERNSSRTSGPGPRFGRSRTGTRCPPVLRLSPNPTRENNHPYFARRHSSDISIRRGGSLHNVDMNVALESGSDISAPKAPSVDSSSVYSSTMPTFARPRSPSSFLDSGSLSSRVSLNESITSTGVEVPSRALVIDMPPPPSPTTPLTPVMTQAEDARRKMRKLARHLGESVPVDLVLGNPGGRHAAHDLRVEAAAPQFLRVYSTGSSAVKTKTGTASPFTLGNPPLGHRKAQSVWKGTCRTEVPEPAPRLVRRASSAEQLRVDTPTTAQMAEDEKARNLHRAAKMLQLFGAPPPHELYTKSKSSSLDFASSPAFAALDSSANRRTSVNSFRDLAYILDHDNRNSLLALIGGDTSETAGSPVESPFAENFESKPVSSPTDGEEPFQARLARANKLAKFFGVSYRDLFDAVCVDDTCHPGEAEAGPSTSVTPELTPIPRIILPIAGSEVRTNNGVMWVEPRSVDEVLDRLRAMKASR